MAGDVPRRDTLAFKAARPSAAGQRTVLVVDDDDALARAVKRILEGEGYVVTAVHDGAAAIETIQQEPFDVILSDIHMPGMSGVDMLRVVRAYDLDVPVILMTGSPSVETAIEAVSLGALRYLQKPTPRDVLLGAVERASRLHQMARMKREALKLGGEDDARAGDRAGLQGCFERALDTMWMAFQPIVDPARGRIFGYEALMRAEEPSLPHPGAILDAAERLDRLPDLGQRVRALSAAAFERAPRDTLLFVNLHSRDLLDPTLYESASPLTKLADRVVLELTERAAVDDVKDIQSRVSVLRFHGFRLAIDDLGAGYAGLSSFVAFEPEIVKLDMSLVRDVHRSEIRRRLIESMTTLCSDMGMRVVAEGVEIADEGDCVRKCGCPLQQGYLYARPGPPFPRADLRP
ncbi:MAG TPA: EAL domain-containing protein [Polyangiaceae bacterium]|jgi:EAL domain-containing protein (putative c-di-GMP-specific phosphodiesterase class I)